MEPNIEPAFQAQLQQATAYDSQQQNGFNHEPQFDITPQQQQDTSQQQLAAQACTSCRKQKRKCDKQIPQCSLCQRIGRRCDYSEENRVLPPSAEEFTSLRQEVAELKHLLSSNVLPSARANASVNSSSDVSMSNDSSPANLLSSIIPNGQPQQPTWPAASSFPSLFFLDSSAFEYERFQIQVPHIRVPSGALAALGSSAELRLMIENFFSSVHTYFPIVSKIRLYQHLANPLHEPGAEVALLFMAMKLVSTELPEGSPPQTQVYQDVKSFYTYMEAQNGFSIQMLQGLLLISLYEYGHGIYPAAYLSVGNAARLGHAMGLHARDVPQMLPRCTTWTEQEERRRVWWGVLILDRISNIGHRGKPFASAEPSPDMHLPTDDTAWDRGQMLATAPLSLSASQTIRASSFARACQSVHLAGKVCRHIDDKTIPLDYRFEEALQLHKTLKALAALLPTEAEGEDPTAGPTLCSSLAICYSALLTLYDAYGCSERSVPDAPESQLVMQKESVQGIVEVCESVLLLGRKIAQRIELGEGLGRLSPLTVECMYEAGASYAWYLRETSNPQYGEKLAEVKELLRLFEKRWRVAGQYLLYIDEFWQYGCMGNPDPLATRTVLGQH